MEDLDKAPLGICVTGGTGSFGREFIRFLLSKPNVTRIVVLSRDEWKQAQMAQEAPFTDERMRFFLGDVRDRDRLILAFRNIDLVVHAAALKGVPQAEYNASEFMLTNVEGSKNVVDACLTAGVKKALLLSSDKACSPSTSYGLTKAAAELHFVNGNVLSGADRTKFACVRYGNVLASRGSVVPIWREQAKTGTITITDPAMSRFYLTLPQAVRFVWTSLAMMAGGETFIPRLPGAKLLDLAEAVAPGCRQEVIGIRANEKRQEFMVSADEAPRTVQLRDRYVILPTQPLPANLVWRFAPFVQEGFVYSSDRPERWLTVEELRAMIDGDEH